MNSYPTTYRVLVIALLLGLITGYVPAQDTVVLHHKYYTSTFIQSRHIPLLVEYELTREMLTCDSAIKRTNHFKPDPNLIQSTNLNRDYKKSGYDRGHNMSAQDNKCDLQGMEECFYFSNMFPQLHALNAGPWEKLEMHERKEAKQFGTIKVFIGSTGKIGTIGTDQVVVPEKCWKVIYHPLDNSYECYVLPNANDDLPFENYKLPLNKFEQLTGCYFHQGTASWHH